MTNIVCDQLINCINLDPRSIVLLGNSHIKTTLKKVFHTEYDQAILTLEVQQKILHLCSAHWKADAMLGQALLRQSKAEAKATMNNAVSTSSKSFCSDTKVFQPSEPCATFIPGVLDIRNTKAMKRALELSPGPKLPSTSHTQKRSKECAMTSMQNIVGPPRGSDCKYCTCTGHKVRTTDSADCPCAREPTPCRTKDSCFIPY